jgi:hypothetical protein
MNETPNDQVSNLWFSNIFSVGPDTPVRVEGVFGDSDDDRACDGCHHDCSCDTDDK